MSSEDTVKQDAPDNRRRLPYEPPGVMSEEVFETLALSCANADPNSCPGFNPDKS